MAAGFVNDGVLHILDEEMLRECLKKYEVSNLRELEDVLWYDYGVTLILDNKQRLS